MAQTRRGTGNSRPDYIIEGSSELRPERFVKGVTVGSSGDILRISSSRVSLRCRTVTTEESEVGDPPLGLAGDECPSLSSNLSSVSIPSPFLFGTTLPR